MIFVIIKSYIIGEKICSASFNYKITFLFFVFYKCWDKSKILVLWSIVYYTIIMKFYFDKKTRKTLKCVLDINPQLNKAARPIMQLFILRIIGYNSLLMRSLNEKLSLFLFFKYNLLMMEQALLWPLFKFVRRFSDFFNYMNIIFNGGAYTAHEWEWKGLLSTIVHEWEINY